MAPTCTPVATHVPGSVEVEGACITCHETEYLEAVRPVHVDDPERYHERCEDCHTEGFWVPALTGPHPEDLFPLTTSGKHNYPCLDCHNLDRAATSEGGADTDCVGCHDHAHTPEVALRRHKNIPSFKLEEYVYGEPPWCMECHAGGRGFGRDLPHPEERFVITRAPHDYECQECHDPSLGWVTEHNTNCIGCHDDGAHSEAAEAQNHLEVPDYQFNPDDPDFCLDCHLDVSAPLGKVER